MMAVRILQFGTSRFLQAHACLFAHEANEAGAGPVWVTVVKGTAGADRAGRVAALAGGDGYPVRIRGLRDGDLVDEEHRVRAVKAAQSLPSDWSAVCDAFACRTDVVISNTGDTGYAVLPGDLAALSDPGQCPDGFPARLTALLWHRWKAGGQSLKIFPCELISGNGDLLRRLVQDLAARAGLPGDFCNWLAQVPVFANSLVDRIVSEPIEPAGAVAEPYALWAIEGAGAQAAPFAHSAIRVVQDLGPHERLKLHILNLSHTVLAERWLQGAADGLLVREVMDLPVWRAGLDRVLAQEVIPGFAAMGMEAQARAYLATTLERFCNPFLDHRLSDIAQNHAAKVARRIGDFIDWTVAAGVPMPELSAIRDRRVAA